MTRRELEHAIRAACEVARDNELIIVGSQAILGAFPTAPEELLQSREVDAYAAQREFVDGRLTHIAATLV